MTTNVAPVLLEAVYYNVELAHCLLHTAFIPGTYMICGLLSRKAFLLTRSAVVLYSRPKT